MRRFGLLVIAAFAVAGAWVMRAGGEVKQQPSQYSVSADLTFPINGKTHRMTLVAGTPGAGRFILLDPAKKKIGEFKKVLFFAPSGTPMTSTSTFTLTSEDGVFGTPGAPATPTRFVVTVKQGESYLSNTLTIKLRDPETSLDTPFYGPGPAAGWCVASWN